MINKILLLKLFEMLTQFHINKIHVNFKIDLCGPTVMSIGLFYNRIYRVWVLISNMNTNDKSRNPWSLLGTDHLTCRGGYGFLFRSEFFFSDNTRVNLFFSRNARNFCLDFYISLYDKNSESGYFFSSTKIRILFSATLGIRIFF
jgi:hypothetical protein